jgi:SAM-dependent methyltransferase
MCADINYQEQSNYVHRLQQLLGNEGKRYLDLACGTGRHIRHFIDYGYHCSGLDINQPMLDIAQKNCPQALLFQYDMSDFEVSEKLDLISCFLYSIHYNNCIDKLKTCIASSHAALNPGGVFCFNAVDKNTIVNGSSVQQNADVDNDHFVFQSGWHYSGQGEQQTLRLSIKKTNGLVTQSWQDQHQMVAVSFRELKQLLELYFETHVFNHAYENIVPWDGISGNAIFVCIKRL